MRKISIIIVLLLAASTFGQLTKQQQVKFHLAQALFDPGRTQEQRELLIRAIDSPSREMEKEAREQFPRPDVEEVFFKIGTRDTKTYFGIRGLQSVSEKRKAFRGLLMAQKATLWRQHWAYIVATERLTREQIDFLLKASEYLNEPIPEEGKLLNSISHQLFSKDLGPKVFIPGPYTSCIQKSDVAPLEGVSDCVCSAGNYNWSCSTDCKKAESGECHATDSGCSFLWLASCTGTCQLGEEQ